MTETPPPPERKVYSSKIVHAAMERLRVAFHPHVAKFGFVRTTSRMWVRRHEFTADWFALRRVGSINNYSVEPLLEAGIHVMNAPGGLPLNAPTHREAVLHFRDARYHHRFNASSNSMFDRTVADLVRYFDDVQEPWFQRFATVDALLDAPDRDYELPGLQLDAALTPEEKAYLMDGLEHGIAAERLAASLKLLCIKTPKAKRTSRA
ncbi:hypothetical protein [Stenotrophomonas maltophilia]|uniref:hypothetical protein n=1 Tax=Stenotrophomonas maltophilia TaxID=40324 RepID=UPI0009A1D044|nr:hypothetical protein [Stenotrophomonas maltophilia]